MPANLVMLFLLFELDGDRYALDATEIVEVMALVPMKQIPGAPPWVAGTIELHGVPVPAIDIAQLALGRPAQRLRSTRMVVVRYRARTASSGDETGTRDAEHRLALIVERATLTARIDRDRFADIGIATPNARWLGPVAMDTSGFVQWVDVEHMLDDDVRALLFAANPPLTVQE